MIKSNLICLLMGVACVILSNAPQQPYSAVEVDEVAPYIYKGHEHLSERLPDMDTNMYTYMDYRKITNTDSNQYKYQQFCTTNDYGIREYDGYFAAALGSFYTTEIGDTYHVTLENGTEFDIFLADCKDDSHTDSFNMGMSIINYDGEDCLNVIEFVVDTDYMSKRVKNCGTFSALDIFGGLTGNGGNIESIVYTGNLGLIGGES